MLSDHVHKLDVFPWVGCTLAGGQVKKVMYDRYKIHAAQEVRTNQIFRQSMVICSRKTGFPYKEDVCDENNSCMGVLIKSLPHFTFV